jgi:hypothetical protein
MFFLLLFLDIEEMAEIEGNISTQALNYLSSSTSADRKAFLKKLLGVFKNEEITAAFRLVINARKRANRKRKSDIKKEEETKNRKTDSSLTLKSVDEGQPSSSALKLKEERGWVKKNYKPKDIVAIDTEYVDLIEKDENGKVIKRAGTVSVVNLYGDQLYSVCICILLLFKVKLVFAFLENLI